MKKKLVKPVKNNEKNMVLYGEGNCNNCGGRR